MCDIPLYLPLYTFFLPYCFLVRLPESIYQLSSNIIDISISIKLADGIYYIYIYTRHTHDNQTMLPFLSLYHGD